MTAVDGMRAQAQKLEEEAEALELEGQPIAAQGRMNQAMDLRKQIDAKRTGMFWHNPLRISEPFAKFYMRAVCFLSCKNLIKPILDVDMFLILHHSADDAVYTLLTACCRFAVSLHPHNSSSPSFS